MTSDSVGVKRSKCERDARDHFEVVIKSVAFAERARNLQRTSDLAPIALVDEHGDGKAGTAEHRLMPVG